MSTTLSPDEGRSPIAVCPLMHFLVGVGVGVGGGGVFFGVGVTRGGFSSDGNLGRKAPPHRFILSFPIYPLQAG